ncbi:MAG: hypothetical protein ACOCXM_03200 [Myxococcota bacterium]
MPIRGRERIDRLEELGLSATLLEASEEHRCPLRSQQVTIRTPEAMAIPLEDPLHARIGLCSLALRRPLPSLCLRLRMMELESSLPRGGLGGDLLWGSTLGIYSGVTVAAPGLGATIAPGLRTAGAPGLW